ncbi:MAG: 50S ribosomal protein L21 [Patescibacteria group bacterium]
MEYAVIRSGNKQYKVSRDLVITVERLQSKAGEKILFDDVLIYVNDGKLNLGKPRSFGVRVSGTVLEHAKGEKIRIAKFKAKSKYRRVTGHRQHLTRIKIDEIKLAP